MSIHNRILCCFVLLFGFAAAHQGQADTSEILDELAEDLASANEPLVALDTTDARRFADKLYQTIIRQDIGALEELIDPWPGNVVDSNSLKEFIFDQRPFLLNRSVANYSYSTEIDPCRTEHVRIKSVIEILLSFRQGTGREIEAVRRPGNPAEREYRVYFYEPNMIGFELPVPPSLARYEAKCFIATTIVETGSGWRLRDPFDFSRHREAFAGRLRTAPKSPLRPVYDDEEMRTLPKTPLGIGSALYSALILTNEPFFVALSDPKYVRGQRLVPALHRYLFDTGDWHPGPRCDDPDSRLRSVAQILNGNEIATDFLVDDISVPGSETATYRVHYVPGYDRGDRPPRDTEMAVDPFNMFLPLSESVRKYQMRCYVSFTILRKDQRWFLPDPFDFSLFRERFERRDLN